MNTVLVTGGAGYIGSHAAVELLANGYDVLILDNYSNSKPGVIDRLRTITGKQVPVVEADIRNQEATRRVFREHSIDAVIHFAALKAVGESVAKPLGYYQNNVAGTVNLLEAMVEQGVKTMVFSSSATVYGNPREVPIREDFPLGATNPYGRSKVIIEDMLHDLHVADSSWRIALLRYFNPVGAHESGLIGEDPTSIPNNLMPYISRVAAGRLKELSVFGDDYPTPDGTGVRDFIHVVDLAKGHTKALKKLEQGAGVVTYNLGTGRGYSVLDMIRAFEQASGKSIPYRVVGRRAGDIATCYADPMLAEYEMGWKAERGLEEMCRDAWRWQQNCPQ